MRLHSVDVDHFLTNVENHVTFSTFDTMRRTVARIPLRQVEWWSVEVTLKWGTIAIEFQIMRTKRT